MSYCLNPSCNHQNPASITFCQKCGSQLLLNDRYRPLKIIGRGGFGRTFLSVDEAKPSRPPCVIKQFLPTESEFMQEAMRLFKQEAVRLDDLGKHPQIPELLAYTEQEQRLYLVQQFINGENLGRELAKSGAFTEVKIRSLLNDLLPVLQFIHDSQVIHRDIKPENIIRRKSDGKLVLVDFGAAKFASVTALAQQGTTIGTTGFAAPEQTLGKAIFSSDIYSLGVTCIYLLTNIEPSELFDPMEGFIWKPHLGNSGNNFISDRLQNLLDKMICSSVKQRYYSATEVLRELNPIPEAQKSAKGTSSSNQPAIHIRLKKFRFETVTAKVISSRKQSGLFGRKTTVETNIALERQQLQIDYFSEILNNGLAIEMMLVPSGKFLMGSPVNEEERAKDESPQHWVNISSFFMSRYPITQAQWQLVMDSSPSHFKGANQPVDSVSWHDSQEFCQKLTRTSGKSYRLPSEAEWEYACRAGTTTAFYFGEIITADIVNFNASYVYAGSPKGKYRQQTTDIDTFPPNAFGLYDMHGNVWEWCQDESHENYKGAPIDGSAWQVMSNATGNRSRILRGGAWNSNPGNCRSAFRNGYFPDSRFDRCGFRIAFSSPIAL